MPVQTENSVAPPERRLHVRQRLDDIVYLDVGAGNGGIVLNLSEKGMGFQAVGPLDKESELRLRIKLPGSKTRIDVTARIAWISDSKRQAGVRFLNVQSEGPVQIQEWIRSQSSPSAPWEESSKQGEEVREFQNGQKTTRELPTDIRLSLMSESESSELGRHKPAEVGDGETCHLVPTAREDLIVSQEPEIVSLPFAEAEKSPSVGPPAIQEESSQAAAFQIPGANASMELDGGDAPIAAPSHDESRGKLTLDWLAPIPRTAAMAIPLPPDAPLKPPERIAPGVESKMNSTPAPVNTIVAAPAATDSMFVWNRAAFAVFFALCAVLCFGIGTWVGQIVTRRNSSNAAAATVNVVPTAEPGINGSTKSNAGRVAQVAAEKVHKGPAPAHSALENRKLAPSMSSPDVLPMPQNTPSNPPKENVTTLATTKGQESNPPVAPALVNSDAAASSPRIVAGLILKPSDRFNPCYLAYRVEASYPIEAQEQRIEGVVKVQQVIGTDGKVRRVKLLSGPPLLVSAALEAAQYWRYVPALLNGQAVETEQDVEIEFRLPH
jgi:TonB family protein